MKRRPSDVRGGYRHIVSLAPHCAAVVPIWGDAYNSLMLVGEIGELALIDRLARSIEPRNRALASALDPARTVLEVGIGDDAAAWSARAGMTVATTDTLVDGVHFIRGQIPWRDLGWKSMAVNLSDIGAMGCLPTYALVTLGLHESLSVESLEEMYAGMLDACEKSGGTIAGGDTVRSPVFFITVALEGMAAVGGHDRSEAALLRRDAASPGDLIAVTGHLGCAAGGLKLLSDARSSPGRAGAEASDHLTQAHFRPTPRVSEGVALAGSGVRAAIDVSDGLVDDLGKLCRASKVAATVRAKDVPVDAALKSAFPDEWLQLAMGGGEDYELLFTASGSIMSRVSRLLPTPVTVIGEIEEGPTRVTVLDEASASMPVDAGGWDHFASPRADRASP